MATGDSQRREDFTALIMRHRSRLFGYILGLVQNMADAEDLFQQTCLILWQKFDRFQPETDFVNWACRTAQFEVLNFIRAKRRSRLYFSEELLSDLADTHLSEADAAEDRHEALIHCMAKLRESDRQLVDLCYGGRFSIKHAAEQIGRPADSVYKSLNRIRRTLLKCINRVLSSGGIA